MEYPKLPPPFDSLECSFDWNNIKVIPKGGVPSAFYNIHQNGPFFFFSNVKNPRNIDFLLFSMNFSPLKEITGGHVTLKLQNIYITDDYHYLFFDDEDTRDNFIIQFIEGIDNFAKLLVNLDVGDCFLAGTNIYACIPSTKKLSEAMCAFLKKEQGIFMRIEIKTLKRTILDIKLGTNCITEPAVTAPGAFGKNPQFQLLIHIQNISEEGAESFILCTSIEEVMKWVLYITKWSDFAIFLQKKEIMKSKKSIIDKPQMVRTSSNSFNAEKQPAPAPPEKKKKLQPKSIFNAITFLTGEYEKSAEPAKNKPVMMQQAPKHNAGPIRVKVNTQQAKKEEQAQKLKESVAQKPKIVEKPPELHENKQEQKAEEPKKEEVKKEEAKKEEVNKEQPKKEEVNKEEAKKEEEVKKEEPKNEEPEKKAPPRRRLVIKVTKETTTDTISLAKPKERETIAISNNQNSQKSKPHFTRRRSLGLGSPHSRQSSIKYDDEKPTVSKRRHDFPEPMQLDKQLELLHKKAAKQQEAKYELPSVSELIPVFDKKAAEKKVQETLNSMTSEINFDDFDSFDNLVTLTNEQIVRETTNELIDINSIAPQFSFLDCPNNIQGFEKEMLIYAHDSDRCETELKLDDFIKSIDKNSNVIGKADTISTLIFLISSIFINGLIGLTPKLDCNIIEIFKELIPSIPIIEKHIEAASAQKNTSYQISVFVQSLILSQDLVPFISLLSGQYDFIAKHYYNESLIASESLISSIIEKLDAIMTNLTFKFDIKADAIKGHDNLFNQVLFLQPNIEHSLHKFLSDDVDRENYQNDFVECTKIVLEAGLIKSKIWNVITEVCKKTSVESDDFDEFKTLANKGTFKLQNLNPKTQISSFLKQGLKRRKLHIWVSFIAISLNITQEYYCECAPLRDMGRAKYVILAIEEVMNKLGSPIEESSGSSK